MKIGILGGTFNPIHIGHLVLAEEVLQKLRLDKILFIPAYLPPHKEEKELLDGKERMKMVRLAVKGNPRFEAADIEIKRKGKSYSIDTLKGLRLKYPPGNKFFFILGSDSLGYLDSWKDIDSVLKLAKFVIASRPGYALKNPPKGILPVAIESLDVSGFCIRQRMKRNESVRYLLHPAVYAYIIKKGFYR